MTAAIPTGSWSSAGAAPLIVSIPTRGPNLREFEPRFVRPWLARKDADWRLDELYDFVRRARRDARAHDALALDDRRQSRSQRRLALSRPGDDRIVPDDDLRRRAALSAGRGARRGRDRRAAAALFRSLPRRAPSARSRGCANASRASRCSTPIRSARAFRACSRASCRCSTSARIRRKSCDPALARGGRRGSRRQRRKLGRRRPLQGRLDHPRTTAAPSAASTRCNSNSPAAPICRSRSASTDELAGAARRCARGQDARDAAAECWRRCWLRWRLRKLTRRAPHLVIPASGREAARSAPD